MYYSWQCIREDPVAFYYQIIYYTYLLVVLAISLALAIQTSRVKIEVLNDSKWISAIVYFVVPTILLFFVLTFVLAPGPFIHLSAAIYCVGLFISSSIFLGFLFIPKVNTHVNSSLYP